MLTKSRHARVLHPPRGIYSLSLSLLPCSYTFFLSLHPLPSPSSCRSLSWTAIAYGWAWCRAATVTSASRPTRTLWRRCGCCRGWRSHRGSSWTSAGRTRGTGARARRGCPRTFREHDGLSRLLCRVASTLLCHIYSVSVTCVLPSSFGGFPTFSACMSPTPNPGPAIGENSA